MEATPEILLAFRDKHDLTQVQLGVLLFVWPNTLARWERGEKKIGNPRMIMRLLLAIEKKDLDS